MKTITSIESNKNFSSEVQAWQLKDMTGETVTIHGSVYKIRKMHGFAFVLLRSGGEILQCVYEETRADFPLEKLTEECCIKRYLRNAPACPAQISSLNMPETTNNMT